MNNLPDFTAKLNYFTTEAGGRKTPALSNYMPQVKFNFSELQIGGRQKFINKEIVNPGDDVIAEITLLLSEPFKNKLKVGFTFEFKEGPRVIGNGIILKIFNEQLLAL